LRGKLRCSIKEAYNPQCSWGLFREQRFFSILPGTRCDWRE